MLRQQNLAGLAESLIPLHLYIEYGAAVETLVSLRSLGLSRTTAILLKNMRYMPNNGSRSRCQAEINQMDAKSVPLAEVCREEIRKVQRVQ